MSIPRANSNSKALTTKNIPEPTLDTKINLFASNHKNKRARFYTEGDYDQMQSLANKSITLSV